jgi:hypothetical protein
MRPRRALAAIVTALVAVLVVVPASVSLASGDGQEFPFPPCAADANGDATAPRRAAQPAPTAKVCLNPSTPVTLDVKPEERAK